MMFVMYATLHAVTYTINHLCFRFIKVPKSGKRHGSFIAVKFSAIISINFVMIISDLSPGVIQGNLHREYCMNTNVCKRLFLFLF